MPSAAWTRTICPLGEDFISSNAGNDAIATPTAIDSAISPRISPTSPSLNSVEQPRRARPRGAGGGEDGRGEVIERAPD